MRLLIFALISFFSVSTVLGAGLSPQAIGEATAKFAAAPGIDSTAVAFAIIDLNSGKRIAHYNADLPLIPASIMKSLTIATLLRHVGIDYKYSTLLLADGPIKSGTLDGNLVIKGTGDPSLNSKAAPHTPDFINECVQAIKKRGVQRITGKILTDETALAGPSIPASWMKGDLPHAYGTGSHALNFENNASGNRSVANPAALLAERLSSALKAEEVEIEDQAINNSGSTIELFSHLSAPIDDIMRSCMMRSDNLFAEAMLRTFSRAEAGDGSTANGAKKEADFWKNRRMPMSGVNIVDGSGLSRSNKLTATFLSAVLQEMSEDVNYASYFPLAGQEGTLRSFLAGTPLEGYIALKTGSMNGIQCYAGYKLDDDYAPTHVVVMMINKMPSSRQAARNAASELLLSIFVPSYSTSLNP